MRNQATQITKLETIKPAPSAPQPEPPEQLDLLMADLSLLDGRLERAVERLRVQLGGTDADQRGLIIEEGDVDRWMGCISAGHEPAHASTDTASAGCAGGRLRRLGDLFGLSPLETAALLTAVAPEVDLAYSSLYAYVQDDVMKKSPTLGLVATLWCGSLAERVRARGMLAPEAALRRHLVLSVEEGTAPLPAWPLHVDRRIASYLLGSDDPDPALGRAATVLALAELHENGATPVQERQIQSLEQLARAHTPGQTDGKIKAVHGAAHGGLVAWLKGPEKAGKLACAEHLARRMGTRLVVVDTPLFMGVQGDLDKRVYRAFREALLQDAIIFWQDADTMAPAQEGRAPELPAELARALEHWQGCALFDVRSSPPLNLQSGPLSIQLDFPAPSNEHRRLLWEHALSGIALASDVDLGLITGAFRLTGDQIASAAGAARHSAAWRAASSGDPDDAHVTMHDLLLACRANSNRNLGAVARKITPVYTWNDLVLPTDRLAQLHEMCLHVKFGPTVFEEWGFERKLSRGRGLNVLFAGQPGTGKTMAAEVLATELGLELYKVDLSSVVSKYIGETEKNLEKIFNEGQTSNAILFFDEADSLFGKRSEVKDSHDRYANIETSYLLQRMEEYDGIVILATNLRKNLDDAFIRRLHGAVEFPMPEEPDRLQIWRRTFPQEAPVAPDVDLAFLAKRFKLSGGNIKNIVLEAAFYAAEAGTAISMAHLVRATRREHQKVGKLIHLEDFGLYAHMLRGEAVDPTDR